MQSPTYRTLLSALASLAVLSSSVSAVVSPQGCYVASGLAPLGSYQYQSEGYCSQQCIAGGYSVFGMSDGNVCACGNAFPSTTADASNCDTPCVGYPSDTCGGTGYYSVWLTGVGTLSGSSAAASSAGASSSSEPDSTTKKTTTTPAGTPTQAAPSVVYVTTAIVQQGVTVVQTVSASTPTATSTPVPSSSLRSSSSAVASAKKKSSSGVSGGAIAGIVIGVLAALAVGAALLIFFARRRAQKTDEFPGEYKRHIEAGGAGVTQGSSPQLDNRLDTSLAIRRNSSESLADNQDYSRKILRVVNYDNTD